jgi:hypothetical protein
LVEAQAELGEGGLGELPGVFDGGAVAGQDDEVIGVADDVEAGGEERFVEGIEAEVGEQWGERGPLGEAEGGAGEFLAVPNGEVEPESDEASEEIVGDEGGEAGEDDLGGDGIEEGLDVGVEEPEKALGLEGVDAFDGLADTATAAIGEAAVFEFGFEDGFEKGGGGGLEDAVGDGGNEESAAIRGAGVFFDFYEAEGPGCVGGALDGVEELGEVGVEVGLEE